MDADSDDTSGPACSRRMILLFEEEVHDPLPALCMYAFWLAHGLGRRISPCQLRSVMYMRYPRTLIMIVFRTCLWA